MHLAAQVMVFAWLGVVVYAAHDFGRCECGVRLLQWITAGGFSFFVCAGGRQVISCRGVRICERGTTTFTSILSGM